MSLILVINLILIPKIDSKAVGYIGDFHFTYNGVNFYFDFVNGYPENYTIDESVFRSVIESEMGMDTLRIANEGYIISSSSSYVGDIFSLIVNAALQLSDKTNYLSYIDNVICVRFDVTYIGFIDDHYIFSFSSPFGTQDIRLNSSGLVPSPSDHTYTTHDNPVISGIVDDQIIDDQVYIPQNTVVTFSDLASPYIVGKSLRFTIYKDGTPIDFEFEDFTNTILQSYNFGSSSSFIAFYNGRSGNKITNLNTNTSYIADQTNYSVFGSLNAQGVNHGIGVSGSAQRFSYKALLGSGTYSFNLPTYYQTSFGNNISFYAENSYGCLSNQNVAGSGRYIFLKGSNVNPIVNPTDIVIPYDVPVPVEPIIDWPYENLPDDDPTGDPEPVDPYEPVIPPIPFPVPSVPPLVSGNDDLWPGLNITFDIEDDLIGLANPLINFQWPSFSSIISSFLDSIVWVSAIMTALFNGTDYNVLFSVLSVFFIAASIFGLYKWWHK